jgi:beta-lactamase regulating signal transducer with metallopeptidase domain
MYSLFQFASAEGISTSSVTTMITDLVSDVGTVLVSGIGLVLGIIGILMGLVYVLKFAFKKIGGAK